MRGSHVTLIDLSISIYCGMTNTFLSWGGDLIHPHRVQIVVKKTVSFPFLLFDEMKSIKRHSEVPEEYFIYLKVVNELGLFSSAFL